MATARHRAGDLVEARRLYALALAQDPSNAVALFRAGLLELQENHPQAALPLIQRALALSPDDARHHFGHGEVLAALRRWPDAAAAYRRALDADPRSADAHFALGNALQSLQDDPAAIPCYEAAIQIQPDFAEAFNNLGNSHLRCRNLPQAHAAYQRALALRPADAGAMSNLAAVLLDLGRSDDALQLLRQAACLQPDAASPAINLGAALCRQKQFAQAAEVLQAALAKEENNPDVAFNLATALHGLGQPRQAARHYRRAAQLRPDHADALNNLGNIHKELGEFPLALASYEAAIQAQPRGVSALNNLGCLLRKLGRLEEAQATLRRALAIDPRHPALYDNLGNVLKDAGQLDEAIASFRQALALDPANAASHSNLAYSLSFQSPDPAPILAECLRWNARHAAPLQAHIPPHPPHRPPRHRLRIGYVSPDFRDHCQSLFTIPLLAHHDHAAFEIVCYSSVERPDDHTRRIAGYADLWREVRALDDAALSQRIREDRIDILVDLTMHMADGRPLVFARRPAPIQVAWLAYPGTTGIAGMDVRFSDPRLDPPGFEAHYSERTIHLPDSFWCYDPLADQPQINPLPALACHYLTLGCLNNPCKFSDHTLRLWAGVLRRLPDARLLLMAPPGAYRPRLLQRLASQGAAPDRIAFVPFRPRAEYLRTYHQIDLGLDTFPYSGHTTSLDSFWMGVPVVTRIGATCVGRGGLSQLYHLNLTELAAHSDEAFIDIAVALGSDLHRLAALRSRLRPRLQQSPLMDGPRFARHIEDAYRRLWQDKFSPAPPP